MMPVWGGWLMLIMGIVVGWIIGHQLGVQAEARRVQRSVELVLHPPPRDWLGEGMEAAATTFASIYTVCMRPEYDRVWFTRAGSPTPEQTDQDFIEAMRYYAATVAGQIGLETIPNMPHEAFMEFEDYLELEESHMEDVAGAVAWHMKHSAGPHLV